MKISVSFGGFCSYFDRIRYHKDCGFDAADFQLQRVFRDGGPLGDIDHLTDQMIEDFFTPLRKEAERVGFEFGQTHSYFGGRLIEEPEEQVLKREIASIKATHFLGVKYCVMHPIIMEDRLYDRKYQENFEAAVAFYRKLIPTLEEYDVYGCIENMFAADPVHKHYCPTVCSRAEEMVAMCEALGDRFKICLDVGHAVLGYEDPVRMVYVIGDRLAVLHVHDNDGYGDLHTYPFCAYRNHQCQPLHINWPALMKALDDVDYKGNLNFEIGIPGPAEIHRAGYLYLAEIGRYLSRMRDDFHAKKQ